MKMILFRGGMAGDLIALMLDKTLKTHINQPLQSSSAGHLLDTNRTKLKKFWKYNTKWKENYITTFKPDEIITTHDTDFAKLHKDKTIQIVCFEREILTQCAKRFKALNTDAVIQSVHNDINGNTEFITDYVNDLEDWVNAIKFKHQFNIKNLGNINFLNDMYCSFPNIDKQWAKEIYISWLKNNNQFTPVLLSK